MFHIVILKDGLAQRFSQGRGMVYKIFMCVNTFVGHTDKNEKEKYFQNKYVGQIGS